MTRLHTILQHLSRMACCLAVVFCVALDAAAQTDYSQLSTWDGTAASTALRSKSLVDPSATGEAGSETNPYLIESAADLKYLQKTNSLWGKCFEQMVDIDLGDYATHGKLLGAIGSTANGNTPFTGKYDGRGHFIKNLRAEWNTASNLACGLFGYFKGEVRNLVIDQAVVTRGDAATATINNNDFKIGVLAGCIAPKDVDVPSVIENISIINSQINDGGKPSDIKAAFIGGLVGDISNGFGGTHRMDKYGSVVINNIYCEVEIDLTNYTPNGTYAFQCNIGGIFGRLRRGLEEDLPTNTLFTGSIKAPNGMVGPIFGASRADTGNNEKGMMLHYAGQVTPEGETDDEPATYHFIDAATFNATNLFYDYRLWDDREGVKRFVDVDGTTPSVVTTLDPHTQGGITRGASFRSFVAPNATSSANTYAAIGMNKFQGVNKGGRLPNATAAAAALSALDATSDYSWNLNTTTKDATFSEKIPAAHALTAEQTAWNQFTATLSGATAGETFHYRWFTVNAKGERAELGVSDSPVFEHPLPIDTKLTEAIVFLCNEDDTYCLDNGHYVYAFCSINYHYDYAVEFTVETAADGIRSVVTPILKLVDWDNAYAFVGSADYNPEWKFEIKLLEGNTEKYTFPTLFTATDAPYTLQPTVSYNAYVLLTATFRGRTYKTIKQKVPTYLRGNTSSGWEREVSGDGQVFTLTFGSAYRGTDSNGNPADIIATPIYFDSNKTMQEDWGVAYTWDIGYYVADGNSFNGIKDKDLALSEEWEEDGKLKVWAKDFALYSRYYRISMTDMYGMTTSYSFQWSNNWINPPHSAHRYLDTREGLQNYHFRYDIYNGTGYTAANPELANSLTYTYNVTGVDDEQNLPLEVTLGDFSIPNVYMQDREYVFTMHDAYGQSQAMPNGTKLQLRAPEVDIIIDDDHLLPQFTFDSGTYYIQEEDGRGLTYSWKAEFYDEDDQLIDGATLLGTGNTFDAVPVLPAKYITVTLEVEDAAHGTKTIAKTWSLDDISINIEQTGLEPYFTLNAALTTTSGLPLTENGEWQWYGVNGDIVDDTSNRFPLAGKTSSTLTLDDTNNNYNAYCAVWKSDATGTMTVIGYWAKTDIVFVFNRRDTEKFSNGEIDVLPANLGRFEAMLNKRNPDNTLYYPDGDDRNTGRTPKTAVHSMKRAYELLNANASAKENIIVVMGYLDDFDYLRVTTQGGKNPRYDKCATITGSYGEVSDGILKMVSSGNFTGQTYENGTLVLGGATIFRDITFYGHRGPNTNGVVTTLGQCFLYCQLHDLTIGNGVKVEGYVNYSKNVDGIYDSPAPKITIVGGMHNYNGKLNYPTTNAVEGQTTLNIYSGNWGRIIASARNDAGYNPTSHNIFGHPDHPHRVEVNIAIKHTPGKGMEEYAPEQTSVGPANKYLYDIGLLTGGQTDGSIYVESKQNMLSGKVGRFISGNISYGRKTFKDTDPEQFPADGFFGSSELFLEGGEIGELVGGSLGRWNCTSQPGTDKCEAYFYGRSILNINGGTIHNNIYGAGAGGVAGLGDDTYHTKDRLIPYYADGTDYNGYRRIAYGNYATAKGNMPTIILSEEDDSLKVGTDGKRNMLDLAETYCEVNVNGGRVRGNVFGGGYGYAVQVAVDKALDQAGDLFGRSYVNITGGTIEGNVYGAGAGASQYYKMATDSIANAKVPGVDWTAAATAFRDLANLYGDTRVHVSGGIIEGRIYAGSKGISGIPEMATINGNTHLTVNNVKLADNSTRVPIINGNIYGGAELGRITGDTHVHIDGGAVGNAIFGGSEGIEEDYTEGGTNYLKTTAYIDGSTHLTVTGGTYFTPDHVAQVPIDNFLHLNNSTRTFNIYGGGYRNCIIKGNTNVRIERSLLTTQRCLLEGRTFEDCANDETYRKFSVYGAGRGILTDVFGNANLDIALTGGASVPSSKPIDVANAQQFFMICGGGFAGNVYGDTRVTLSGNIFARSVYGGGMYGRVEGTANTFVYGGSYHNVYGGGLLGDIMKGANLTIGVREGDPVGNARDRNRNIYIYQDVFGGNDVGGIVGYERALDSHNQPIPWKDNVTNQPFPIRYLFANPVTGNLTEMEQNYTLHSSSPNYGANVMILGGTILGDVFGAGNGNHMGYYVPNQAHSEHNAPGSITRMKYHEGPAYLYRFNSNDPSMTNKSLLDEEDKVNWGLYEYRPRIRRVRMHIAGNSEEDRVRIGGNVYGGGYACTIGKYNPEKDPLKDPTRFEGGGSLKMNFGSHVTVAQGVYMGSRGEIVGKQTVIEGDDAYTQSTLNSDYDYHYFDKDYPNEDGTIGRYLLGFPNSVEGRNRFHAYLKLIDMDAQTQLTFYDNPKQMQSVTINGQAEQLLDLKDYDPATFDARDLRWGSFFAGGARGSMTYEPENKTDIAYEYTLPEGLTVETRVVGGSEDAEVVFYQYAPDYKSYDTTKPIFTYYGGIVHDDIVPDSEGIAEGQPGYSYGHYGGGVVVWNPADGVVVDEKEKTIGSLSPRGSRTVMKLTVNCQFDPQPAVARNASWDNYKDLEDKKGEVPQDAGEHYYGGLVYGGCYNSGLTNGSVEVICTNSLLGNKHFESKNFQDYLTWSSLRRNVGRVYGGGFGVNSAIWGNTKVVLDGNARCFNVFGGGMRGAVHGGTDVSVQGRSLVYNAVYGGGLRGSVGKETYSADRDADLYAKGTHVHAISGGIDRIYGGAFVGEVYGGTHITATDEAAVDKAEASGESPVRLLVGSIFGGNDVTGNIHPDQSGTAATNPAYGLTTHIDVWEKPSSQKTEQNGFFLTNESATEHGKFYAGYPMIGTIYGAGNGNMSEYVPGIVIDKAHNIYTDGRIHVANGQGADYDVVEMSALRDLPNVARTKIDIKGGTIVNAYAGGSMCTTTESNHLIVNMTDTVARAAFATANSDPMTWGILRLFNDLQQTEVTEKIGSYTRFSHQIYRAFGGNNLMDMAIQPNLDLRRGYVFSAYSGGNFGRMTYPDGLSLTVNSPDIHLQSVYGGGRVGDIDATDAEGNRITFDSTKYGATLNILDGILGDVYGGNNVAGTVFNGTNVNIHGAISGNVYGSGNGNYIYLYDHDNSHQNPERPGTITEGYDKQYGGRYFILPKKAAYYNGSTPVYYGTSDEEKILAINSYRPNVEKAFLNIHGREAVGSTPAKHVFVLGDVFCGGNSSTVLYKPQDTTTPTPGNPQPDGDIRFEIGSHVTLGGVFLGSNGEGLADAYNITYLSNLNHLSDMAAPNQLATREGFGDPSKVHYNDRLSYDTALYPNLISLYMRAAEVTALPTNFALPTDAVNANIGNFTLGGNYGSMMTDKTIDLVLPENLVIFGRIVGGSYNSRVEFHNALCMGGMTKPLATGYTDKVNLHIKCKFRPWRMFYDPVQHTVSLVNDRIDLAGNYVSDAEAAANPNATYYYREGLGNIFGGCFTSGKTVGNIKIDLYSDMLGGYTNGWGKTETVGGITRNLTVDRDILMNNVALRRTVLSLIGAGYGPQAEVEGDVRLRLMPTPGKRPSIGTVFGGAHDGTHTGNSTVEVRDGLVFSNLYGGSRTAYKYGSSEVIVGYPKYYQAKTDGTFTLNRADQYSFVAQARKLPGGKLTLNANQTYNAFNEDGTEVIKQTVKYRKGDLVAANVAEIMVKFEPADTSQPTIEATGAITPEQANASILSTCFDEIALTPTDFGTTWDDVDINIGDNSAMNDPNAHFYGGGGIYGGGFAMNASAVSYSGINTQLAFDAGHNPDNSATSAHIGFGGNSTIAIGDNPQGNRDHISIGTGHYVKLKLTNKDDKIGTYLKVTDPVTHKTTFVHQAAGTPVAGEEYYSMETEGGVYGDGRRTFVQNFRAVDITGYGYCDYTPQSAKLINTFQRIDLLSLNDCCMQLQGAQDYATNTIDATLYSIARIGELRMNSSLTGTIERSVKDNTNIGNMSLDLPKSRNYMGFFKNVHYVGALYSNTDFTSGYRDNSGEVQAGKTYRSNKQTYIDNYENPLHADYQIEQKFKPRNLGTAPNMIGINNGYTLKLQNAFTIERKTDQGNNVTDDEDAMLSAVPRDSIYYGPIIGVVEVKLLTVQANEGGGYIYAFNHHDKKNGKHTFLEDTGNFVFASRAWGDTSENENFIIDDCYPVGYYSDPLHFANTCEEDASHDKAEEVHYWYVQGHQYFFNTTLTGYTYNKPTDFYLNNTDALIQLSGITPGTAETIEVESVHWRAHEGDYKSALRDNLTPSGDDSRQNYQLFLSIDAETEKVFTPDQPQNAFVAQIPNGNISDAYGYGEGNTIRTSGATYGQQGANTPLVGIRLRDTDTQNNLPPFYQEHLKENDYVVIKLKAQDEQGDWNWYTINLTIDYLRGPYINGTVNIENCALPGEYIYANTDDITVELDDELTITDKRWYLYPKDKRPGLNEYYWDADHKVDVTRHIQRDIVGDRNRLQLPARYYQNDWQLDFVVVVNGQEFSVNRTDMEVPRLIVHNYHRMSTVVPAVKQFGGHDSDYGYDLDLDIVGGALVYIETNEDFEIFTKYINYCNSFRPGIADADKPEGYVYRMAREDADPADPAEYDGPGAVLWQKDAKEGTHHWARVLRAEVMPGFNRMGGITGFQNNNTILGYDDNQDVPLMNVKDPSGAENVIFILNTDVETTEHCMPIGQFRGRLIGNGHTINFKSGYQGKNFIEKNYGDIYYVGFASSGGADTGEATASIYHNYGRVNNCFYYNYLQPGQAGYNDYDPAVPDFGRTNDAEFIKPTYASLVQNIGSETSSDGKRVWVGSVDNCYQNSDMTQANALHMHALAVLDDIDHGRIPQPSYPVHGLLHYRPSQSFQDGSIAYNLNQDYLQARWKSHDNDALVREQITASHINEQNEYVGGDFLYDYYADGNYRYAHIYDADLHPEAVRFSISENGWPNYENHMKNGQTMHYVQSDHEHDDRRWFTTERNDIVQIDERGQIIYEEKTETVDDVTVTKIVPKLGNTGYFPLYMHDADNARAPHSDFIFFGQRVTANPAMREYFPRHVNYDNRVYRATGTFGTRTDYGFHFNREAEVIVPQTTAIDFNRTLDLKYQHGIAEETSETMLNLSVKPEYSTGEPQYLERWQFYLHNNNTAETTDGDGNITKYAPGKYYSYTQQAAQYVQEGAGHTTYQENLQLAPTDTLISLVFYPPMLDLPGGDKPENLKFIRSFSVLHNQTIDDHQHVTKNLLIYAPTPRKDQTLYCKDDEERLFGQFHYTRMAEWAGTETDQNDIIGHHLYWRNHEEEEEEDIYGNGLKSHFHAANGLFHLVDRQDFNAPIDFYVADDVRNPYSANGRAWFLRKPKHYAARQNTKSVGDGFLVTLDAWESIALPFTCNRVVAVNGKNYIEKYSRGQITHFYGSDPKLGITHHDYWLRGLVDTEPHADASVAATAHFARPGTSYKDEGGNNVKLFEVKGDINSDGNATDEQMRGDYRYHNVTSDGTSWFEASYGYEGYVEYHNDYREPMTFMQYCYLTKNAPYIISFPGCPQDCLDEDGNRDYGYYEFDLSGNFYNHKNNSSGCNEQEILYEFTVEEIDPNNNFASEALNVRIPVTDIYTPVRQTKAEGSGIRTTHHATFARLSGDEITDQMYVLNDEGTAFINCHHFGINEILPFRTYLTVEGTSSDVRPYVLIGEGTRSGELFGDLAEEELPNEEEEGSLEDELNELKVYVSNGKLHIYSTQPRTLSLYNLSGLCLNRLHVTEGTNVYPDLRPGCYIVAHKKVIVH